MALCQATWIFEGVHIQCCGNGRLGFRPYGGSLGKAPSNQGLLPLSFGASLRLGMPSLRSCSVGPPPSAIHGRGRLTRHPCRVAHCAEPPLGLTRGRTPQQRPRRPTGRPVCWVRSAVMYLVDWQDAIASKLAPTGIEYICKISVGWQAVFASRLAPTVDPGRSARDWSAGRPPSRASPLPQGRGTSARIRSAVGPPSRAGSLLQLIRVGLQEIGRLAGRLRGQARSHRGWGHLQKPGRLSGRHREQARSHRRAKADRRTPMLFTTHQAER
ncbi:hypothetical protein PS843_00776 [Pseudomonas fluorescens]|nr:hypothetical protein PS843_00776 [Pseudomonas fluorescens]